MAEEYSLPAEISIDQLSITLYKTWDQLKRGIAIYVPPPQDDGSKQWHDINLTSYPASFAILFNGPPMTDVCLEHPQTHPRETEHTGLWQINTNYEVSPEDWS